MRFEGCLPKVFGEHDLDAAQKSIRMFDTAMKSNEQAIKRGKTDLTRACAKQKAKLEKQRKLEEKEKKAREKKEAREVMLKDGEEQCEDVGIETWNIWKEGSSGGKTTGFLCVPLDQRLPEFGSFPDQAVLLEGMDPSKLNLVDYKGSFDEPVQRILPTFDIEEACSSCTRLCSCLQSVAWARETYLKMPHHRTTWMDKCLPQVEI